MSDNVQNQISELQVSGHTMALDPGIYCVFSSPGSVPPAADTGLPTVRISAAPGPSAGFVEVSGLDSEGWINPSAATLVRVQKARSNVLVTVYQAKGTKAEAPQLQVVRISGPVEPMQPAAARAVAAPAAVLPQQPPAPAPAAAPAPKAPIEVSVVAHVYGQGDVGADIGEWIGEPGSKRWIEGFGVAPVGRIPLPDIEYQAVLGRGWLSPWSAGGQFCGSRGMSLPILGLRARLRGDSAKTHRVLLEATFIDGSSVGPVADGEPCEAQSLAALEAFKVMIDPIGAAIPAPAAPTAKPAARKAAPKSAKSAPTKSDGVKQAAKAKPEAPAPKLGTSKLGTSKPAALKPAAPKAAAPQPAPAAPKPRASRTPAPTRRR